MPPSGIGPAAFRRLCVETAKAPGELPGESQPPSGGCVLKQIIMDFYPDFRSAAFRRLCVETRLRHHGRIRYGSRLQAAVC